MVRIIVAAAVLASAAVAGAGEPPGAGPRHRSAITVTVRPDARHYFEAGAACQRRGDLPLAKVLLHRAWVAQQTLPPQDRQELQDRLAAIERAELSCQERLGYRRCGAGPSEAQIAWNAQEASQDDLPRLTRLARQLMQQGQLDEAEAVARRAAALPGVRWAFFQDTPERVLSDVALQRQRQMFSTSATRHQHFSLFAIRKPIPR